VDRNRGFKLRRSRRRRRTVACQLLPTYAEDELCVQLLPCVVDGRRRVLDDATKAWHAQKVGMKRDSEEAGVDSTQQRFTSLRERGSAGAIVRTNQKLVFIQRARAGLGHTPKDPFARNGGVQCRQTSRET
jgi:hypothetical protein